MDSSSTENMRSRGGCDPQDAFKPQRELGNLSAALLNIYQPSDHWVSEYLAAGNQSYDVIVQLSDAAAATNSWEATIVVSRLTFETWDW